MNTYENLLRQNRQWRRELRIAHARHMMKQGPEEDRTLWKQVLAANYEDQRMAEKAHDGQLPKRRTTHKAHGRPN